MKQIRDLGWIGAPIVLSLLLTSCATPPVKGDSGSCKDRLVAHVEFLAHPALKGRETGRRGAALARSHISRYFKDAGLLPWNEEKNYEISFGMGRNMIGVLPGVDPVLSKEYVLVSAHYDHEGKRKGKIYPGAADNAAGVAVLLEMARQMKSHPPARSILFAAFDAEEKMMLGSFAFAARKEVIAARISAVVNVDMLGRAFLDVVTNAVFVAGMESYPRLREQVCAAGDRSRLRVFPVGTDLVGPRSDHVAFENRGVPCVFFSCGTFRDYHQPADTPDKLDFAAIQRSAEVIIETVSALANGTDILVSQTNDFATVELNTVSTVLAEAAENAAKAGIREEDVSRFRKLETHARQLLAEGKLESEHREGLAVEASGVLAPYSGFLGDQSGNASERQRKTAAALARFLQSFYFNHRLEAMELCRDLAAQIVEHQPGIFRTMPKISREIYRLEERDISLVETGTNRFRLNVAIAPFSLNVEVKRNPWLINSLSGQIAIWMAFVDGEGTWQELEDICLLALRDERNNTNRFRELAKIHAKVVPECSRDSFDALLKQRLSRSGFTNELQWLIHCIETRNPDLMLRALKAAEDASDQSLDRAVTGILTDTNTRPDVLVAVMPLVHLGNQSATEALCSMLWNSEQAFSSRVYWWLQPEYPFRNRPALRDIFELFRPDVQRPAERMQKTVGDHAYMRLKEICRRDFGRDEVRWQQWLERHRARSGRG